MTFSTGYALNRSDSLEELDMGGESKLLLQVTGEESHGAVTVHIRGRAFRWTSPARP